MTGHESRWENGSFFHWFLHNNTACASYPWGGGGALLGSGRDALRVLLEHGRTARGWRRLWMPSYFCQQVVASAASTGIEVLLYPDCPLDAGPVLRGVDARRGDALLRMNYFGLRALPCPGGIDRGLVEVIDDHTHDPWSNWSRESDADWCVVSLRKVLPVPDGGVLWSPAGHTLPSPPPVYSEHRAASLEKLAAMMLKEAFLRGRLENNSVFRELDLAGEDRLASGPVSGMPEWTRQLLRDFPVDEWRERRRANHHSLRRALAGVRWLTLLAPADYASMCPFAGVMVFDTPERRNHVRRELIARRVYPAVLWPLEWIAAPGIPEEHIELSRRILAVHCDMRYSASDMRIVARVLRDAGESCQVWPCAKPPASAHRASAQITLIGE